MCNLLVAQGIVEILEQKILDGEVFTAFDVTLAVRNAEKQKPNPETILHDDVRNIVNNEFVTSQIAGYDRELCTLDLSNSPQAFVYFPDTKSATDHQLVDSVPVSQPMSQPMSQPAIAASTVDLDVDEVKTTKEGRVQIPRDLTSQVTPNGGSIDVLINGTLKCVSFDARGAIRICLHQFGIKDSKVKVTVDTTNNTIIVETV